jgi:lantibiotic biosynthesis protein
MDYKKVLQEISVALDDYTEQENSPGLLGGYTGCALFYAYYYHLTGKKKHLKKVHSLLLKSIEALSEVALLPSHCNGISGIVWCIQHLIQAGFASDEGMEDVFTEADELLGITMGQEIQENRSDFLHEGLGIALYFLEKEQPSPYLNTLVKQLEAAAYKDEKGIRWIDHISPAQIGKHGEPAFNLGLAHGTPSMISILGMIHHKGINTAPLLEKSTNWLLATKNEPEEGIFSLYPTLVDVRNNALTGKHSRIGWCYGDLSIAVTLLNVGICLQNDFYKEEARKIFDYTLQYRNNENGIVRDACLCHGSAGIAHIYRRAYLSLGDPHLLLAAEHWLQQTLQMKTWKDGAAGFKFYSEGKYENNYGILEGIAGIGLTLIAALDPDTLPAWDRCLLLS